MYMMYMDVFKVDMGVYKVYMGGISRVDKVYVGEYKVYMRCALVYIWCI